MKTAALSFGKWFLLAAILAAVGILSLVGRKRGTAPYRWRIALWAFALTLMGTGVVMASPRADGDREAAFDNSGALDSPDGDEVAPKCYKPVKMCYKTLPPDPPKPPPKDPDDDSDDDDDGDDDGDDATTPKPPEVMPTCYAPKPIEPPPPPPPTCYKPMPSCYEAMPVEEPPETPEQ